MVIVPPGGFAGFSQMTPASKASLTTRGSARSGVRRRKSKGKKARTTTRKRSRSGGGRKLKFGSKAWRAKYGAKAKRNAAKARRK